jgi:MSHA biogenesis protein MshQ
MSSNYNSMKRHAPPGLVFLLCSIVLGTILPAPRAWGDITSVTKTFSPASIPAGGTTTLTVTITNSPPGNPSSIAFTDNYPAGVNNAAIPGLTSDCGGTATAAANGSALALTGGSVSGNKSCTVSVSVIACAAGSYTNPSFGVSSSTNALNSNAASLAVTAATPSSATSTVAASPASVPADGTSTSTITVILYDGCGNPVPGKSVTLAAGSGSSIISAASGTSNASGVVTFTVKDSVLEAVSYTATDTTDSVTIAQTATVTFTASGSTGPNHYELSLPTSSVTCVPATVTVTACNDASSPCTNPSTLLNGTTAVLATSGGSLGATTVTFDATGVASTTLSYAAAPNGTPAVVSLSGEQVAANNPRQCCANGTSCSVANSCTTTFNTAGFIFSSSAGGGVASIPTQIAGVSSATTYLRAVQSSTTTQACVAALTGSQSVNFAYECNNPTTCYTSNLMSVNGGNATTIAGNSNGSVTNYVPVNMTFDSNGNAPFAFNYSDAGQVTLWVSKAASGSLLSALTGSSNAFVVKPDHFSLSNIACTTVGAGTCAPANSTGLNPAASNSAGAAFIQAGQPFTATVTAMTGAATPAPTPNFGRETTPETVKLTPTLVAPAGGAAGTLSGAFGAFVNGVATGTAFTFSEVGIISVTPSMGDGNYLGAGDTVGATSVNIGRFIPDHFDTYVLSLSGLPMLCPPGLSCPISYNGFVYSGEPFGVQVVAKNAGNVTTQNYDGALGFSKAMALSAWNAVGGGASNPGGGTLNNAAVAAGTFSLGSATVTGATAPNYSLPNPTAPTNIYVRATDSDSVTSLRAVPANSIEGGVGVANGRLRLFNNYGSEKSSLDLNVQAQYWSGKSWVLSSTDSTTTIPATSVALSNYRDSTGAPTGAWTTSASGPGTLSGGQGTLTLSAPSPAGQTGCVDVAFNLGTTTQDNSCLANHPAMTPPASSLVWLRGQNGSCPAPADPSATACFGVYSPETTRTIHVRELF